MTHFRPMNDSLPSCVKPAKLLSSGTLNWVGEKARLALLDILMMSFLAPTPAAFSGLL